MTLDQQFDFAFTGLMISLGVIAACLIAKIVLAVIQFRSGR